MKLSDITEKSPLVADFSKRLTYTAKQKIVNTEIEKTKRVSGASVRPVNFIFENGQTLKIYLRLVDGEAKPNEVPPKRLDVIRIDINGKQIPMSGDYDNSYKPSFNASVDLLANAIKSGQKSFDLKRAKVKVRAPRTGKAPMNKAQQRKALLAEASDLDVVIDNKTKEKTELTEQLEKLTNQ